MSESLTAADRAEGSMACDFSPPSSRTARRCHVPAVQLPRGGR